ncbi:hypothetical protein QAD02_024167 [Eretmocerus hayati]|uniref:Uncharacterized protein n=1 Tax=Eretmocerus hayati TaxID=131215 RepID=A0ACC2PY24_9HYME|nr:hypothetical protein QAD02_024167 [Eretmocerus hayati]
MEMEDENGKKSKNKNRTRAKAKPRATRTKTRARKAVKVIESDDEDVSQAGDENTMETSAPNSETQISPAQPTPKPQPTVPIQSPQKAILTQPPQPVVKPIHHPVLEYQQQQHFDLEADISQLEPPTFTTINRGPPEPMLRLRWDHRVNLIGEKVLNPMIHCCDKCLKPILIYGRMIPCKHVFCLLCAKKEDKVCPRCLEKVSRVEQTGLGTVFMCTHGGTRYGNAGCRRTYLSQRDLQAHINHRHVTAPPAQPVPALSLDGPPAYLQQHTKNSDMLMDTHTMKAGSSQNNRMKSIGSGGHMMGGVVGNDPRVNSVGGIQTSDHRQQHRHYSQNSGSGQQQSGNSQMRSNLITVNIQDTPTSNAHDSQSQNHHYYHSDNHASANMTARWVLRVNSENSTIEDGLHRHMLTNQAPPAAPPQVSYGYGVNINPPTAVVQNQQYYGSQHAHSAAQMAYAVPQQQYTPSPRSAYVQDSQFTQPGQPAPLAQPQQQQQQPQGQQQWGHQQQFYR